MPRNLARLHGGKGAREDDRRSNLLWDKRLRIHDKTSNRERMTTSANITIGWQGWSGTEGVGLKRAMGSVPIRGDEHSPTRDSNRQEKSMANHRRREVRRPPLAPGPLETSTMPTTPPPTGRPQPTVARFLLDGPALPLVTDTLRVAEAFRQALLRRYQQCCHRHKYGRTDAPYREVFRSQVFAGKDAQGQCLRDHRHAYYLPTAEGQDPRRLTHITVFAEAGLGRDEVAALNGLRSLPVAEGAAPLRLRLVGLGAHHDFRPGAVRSGGVDLGHAVSGDALSEVARHETRPPRGLRLARRVRAPRPAPGIAAPPGLAAAGRRRGTVAWPGPAAADPVSALPQQTRR